MKKILFFSVLFAVCSAFAAVSYKKTSPVAEEVSLPAPPSLDQFESPQRKEYDKYTKEKGTKDAVSFIKLLQQFPKGTLPYSLTTNVLREQIKTNATNDYVSKDKRATIGSKFLTFFPNLNENSKFSRSPQPLPEAFLAFEAKGKHILIYFTNHYNYKTYYVSVFDAKGNSISEKTFALVNLKKLTTATLDDNFELTRNNYDVIWDKKPDENGYKNCKITELKLTKMTVESLIKKDSEKEIKIEKNMVDRANP
jgi:hypothetical protein